jgi:hypothetical protein
MTLMLDTGGERASQAEPQLVTTALRPKGHGFMGQ